MKRPLIHDLLETILRAFGAKIESVIINDLQRDTYFARFVLGAENEVHEKKIIAIDARPGDGIALATRSPIRFQREKAAEKKRFSSITSRGAMTMNRGSASILSAICIKSSWRSYMVGTRVIIKASQTVDRIILDSAV